MRAVVEVRTATADDLREVADLAVGLGPDAGNVATADPARLCEHLSVLLASGGEVLVAREDGSVVGFLLERVIGPHLFAATPSLSVDAIGVAPTSRRRGVGRALLGAALATAVRAGAENIYCAPALGDREMHRFLARLGFAPAAGHRVVAVAALERRLAQEPAATGSTVIRRRDGARRRREATRAAIEDLVARRRRAREAGLPTGPVDLRAFQAQQAATGLDERRTPTSSAS
ncbi:GNAT family N-acetyltransferase [Isoptericola aurantiacus]|uniref:GNAT family N-acetyltransferase n=1 Tax=Isoptericola aurantiacus TaxID=3377839 RepID=UPI00383BD7BA